MKSNIKIETNFYSKEYEEIFFLNNDYSNEDKQKLHQYIMNYIRPRYNLESKMNDAISYAKEQLNNENTST